MGADIIYIPMAKGFVYLCVIVDRATRKVVAHRVSISSFTTRRGLVFAYGVGQYNLG